MQDFISTQKKALEEKGVNFIFASSTVNHLGRSKDVQLIELETTGRGRYSSEVAAAVNFFIPAYNAAIENNAKTEIESEIAKGQEIALQASQATAKQLQDLREQLTQQAAENAAKVAASEKARKKPLLQITAYFGLSLTILVALVLVGLNFFNATYFLGENLHWAVLLIFALLFGASFVYFALSRNGKALKMLVWVVPFDLVVATLVKPFLGNTKTLQLFTENGFNWVGFSALVLFLIVYGVQLFHACNAVAKLLNPKELTKKEEEEHLTKVLDSIQ